ncbi:hypothetical protein [Haloplanus halobius]|uniref:hypothetical protein n=1 Tax=Haloplanus halobius TaxID=2934938 RepID=UPI00200E0EB8|nr:hypothetical protein [Haloplanus sp. XH21]
MSTQPQSTTDRTASTRTEPTLTDGRWRADDTTDPADAALHAAQLQFLPDGDRRLYNLVDDENRAMLD